MKVEIYSDLVCPWCYIGKRRLGRALAAFAQADQVEVVFRPYQLDPGAPVAAVPLAEYLEQRFGRHAGNMLTHVSAAAKAEDIAMAWDRALSVNTRTAHRLLDFAEREYGTGAQRTLVERLFNLHFTRGGNLGDVQQLAAEAAAAGMDHARVTAYLESDAGSHELDRQFEHARQLGIRAVPTFVFDGKWFVEGAQPLSTFLEVLEGRVTSD